MSIELLKKAFDNVIDQTNWSLQLLKIHTSSRKETNYACRQISIKPNDRLVQFINDLTSSYLSRGKRSLDLYQNVLEYDGTADSNTIYRLSKDNPLISSEYASLIKAVANPDVEADASVFKSAYILKGTVNITDYGPSSIKLVTMQSPFTILKNKFWYEDGIYSEISGSILTLKPSVDVVILNDTVYFLTLAGENLFNMSRAYKAVCHKAVTIIEKTEIINDFEPFRIEAESGHNPRKFVSFNEERLDALKDVQKRKAIAKQFSIKLTSNNKFDTTVPGTSDKIVKLLCNKGMVDPFNKLAVEVTGAKQWE